MILFRLSWLAMAGAVLAVAVATMPAGATAQEYVLAVSWQPAFCETRPEKPECASQTDERFDATHFALHGLWPQPRGNVYCGVDEPTRRTDETGNWADLPAIGLTTETRDALARVMPGMQSFLHRHEWIKHGTCYGTSPEAYFADSLRLMAELNASPLRALFAGRIGRPLAAREIRAAVDEAFGPGAGDRVHVACRRIGVRRLLTELTINLAGPIGPARDLRALLRDAPASDRGCRAGIVDRVGVGLGDDPS